MKSAQFHIVLVTAPNLKTARKLAHAVLELRLVACANIVPRVESHYWWRGKIESATEVLLILKTAADRIVALEETMLKLHPYDTPEFLALPIERGNRRYLDWLRAECAPSKKSFAKG